MKRGEIYYAAVPFLPEAPLKFFTHDMSGNGKRLPTGKVEEQLDNCNLRGETNNPEYEVILPIKRRMILIVSEGKLRGIPGVMAMPIFSIKQEHVSNHPFYRKMIIDNRFKETFYLGTRTGRHAYVSVTDVKLTASSLIFEKVDISLSPEEMTSIDVRLADCLNNSIVLACQVCDRNCSSCQLLRVANSFLK